MIVVFGSINLDLIYRLEAMPAPGQTLLAHDMTTEPGGKGANQAVAAARDGAAVVFAGAVGEDALAETAIAGMRDAGVDLSRVATVAGPTGSAAICIDAAGRNQIVVAPAANAAARAAQVEDALLVPDNTIVLQMEVPVAENEALIRRARAAGARTILNLAPAMPIADDALRLLDVLVVNEEEGNWLLAHLGATTEGGAAALHGLLGIAVVRTLGGDGVEWADTAGHGSVGAPTIEVVDTTAAGDCFVGIVAAALDRGATLEAAIRRASAAAPIACMRKGSQRSLPDAAEINAALFSSSPE